MNTLGMNLGIGIICLSLIVTGILSFTEFDYMAFGTGTIALGVGLVFVSCILPETDEAYRRLEE